MGILWFKQTKDCRYEVRSAGNSIRLYTNGVFHSQFNPLHPISGSLWDMLMIPAFFHPPGHIQRVLVLGVGGGAVIRLLNQFIRPREIIGVELNPVHIKIAKRFFGVGKRQAILECADAAQWVNQYQGPAFDMIIDDLFHEVDGEPERAVTADARWLRQLSGLLYPDGILVMNFVSKEELMHSAYLTHQGSRKRFRSGFRLKVPKYENSIAVLTRHHTTSRKLHKNMMDIPGLSNKLQVRLHRI